MSYVLIFVLLSPALLWCLYPIAIQYERGGWWWVFLPITLFALLVDVAANYTMLALIFWDFPRRGEWTFTKRLRRLIHIGGWRGSVSIYVSVALDVMSPSGKHV